MKNKIGWIVILILIVIGYQSINKAQEDMAPYELEYLGENIVETNNVKYEKLGEIGTPNLEYRHTVSSNGDKYDIYNRNEEFLFNLDYLKNKQEQEEIIGEGLKEFLESASKLEAGGSIEDVINGYGLFADCSYRINEHSVYVIKPGIKFKNETLKKTIDNLCGDNLLLTAIGVGEEKIGVELEYPRNSVITGNICYDESSYYKLTLDKLGNVEKMKFIVLYSETESPILPEEKYNHLKYMLEQITGEELDTHGLNKAIKNSMNKGGKNSKGNIGNLHYKLKKMNVKFAKYQKMIVVDFK